jgi:signal transduction histidine kinase
VLGIALARDLADLLGGSLEAESKAGDGTHFRIALPMS